MEKPTTDKRTKAQELHKNGATFTEIARQLGISRQRAHQLVTGYRTYGISTIKKFPHFSEICGDCSNPAKDTHHIDGNSANNSPVNLVRLCKPCHYNIHKKMRQTDSEYVNILWGIVLMEIIPYNLDRVMNRLEKNKQYEVIREEYKRLRDSGVRKMEAYRIIATAKNMTERRIRQIVKEVQE